MNGDNFNKMIFVACTVLTLSACSPTKFESASDPNSISGGPGGPGGGDPNCTNSDTTCPNSTPPPPPHQVDEQLTAKSTNKIDVMLVIDNSGSMEVERAKLGSTMKNFLNTLTGFDWRLCVTTTDISDGNWSENRPPGAKGKPLTFSNGDHALTPSTANADSLLIDVLQHAADNGGSGDERGIYALNLAFQNPNADCHRSDAAQAAIILSDEDERSLGGYDGDKGKDQWYSLSSLDYPSSLVTTVENTWGSSKIFSAHSIIVRSGDKACFDTENKADSNGDVHPGFYGTRYEQLSNLTGGLIGNICASDYGAQVTGFANEAKISTAALTLQCKPKGAVTVDFPQGVSSSYSVSGNKLLFNPALPDGTVITAHYMCQ